MMCKTWIAQKYFLIALFFLSLLMVGGHSASVAAAEKNEAQLPIAVHGDSGLSGKFYLSFVFDRTVILLDGKGNVVWSKHEEQKSRAGIMVFGISKRQSVMARPITVTMMPAAPMTILAFWAMRRASGSSWMKTSGKSIA